MRITYHIGTVPYPSQLTVGTGTSVSVLDQEPKLSGLIGSGIISPDPLYQVSQTGTDTFDFKICTVSLGLLIATLLGSSVQGHMLNLIPSSHLMPSGDFKSS